MSSCKRAKILVSYVRFVASLVMCLCAWQCAGAQTNLLVNGDFEASSQGLALTEVPGWVIEQGTVDIRGIDGPAGTFVPQHGANCLETVGTPGHATIKQTISTIPGRTYAFDGYLSAHDAIDRGVINVYVNNTPIGTLRFTDFSATNIDPHWVPFHMVFTATSSQTELKLRDITYLYDFGGGFLDNLSIREIPTPIATQAPIPTNYTFTKIADNFDNCANLQRNSPWDINEEFAPALNNSGLLAFWGEYFPGGYTPLFDGGSLGIQLGDGNSPVRTAIGTGMTPSVLVSHAFDLNNNGQVATIGLGSSSDFTDQVLRTEQDGSITTIYDLNDGKTAGYVYGETFSPYLNDGGLLTFNAANSSSDDLLIGNTTHLAPVYNNIGSHDGAPVNSAGDVVYSDGGSVYLTVRPFYHTPSPTLDVAGSTIDNFAGFGNKWGNTIPSINHEGSVAFLGNCRNGSQGIFLAPRISKFDFGSTISIATSSDLRFGPGDYFGRAPSINSNRDVAFTVNREIGGVLLSQEEYCTTNGVLRKVIGTGDALFGSTVTFIVAGVKALNDSGQIGFYYELADGRVGYAKATRKLPAKLVVGTPMITRTGGGLHVDLPLINQGGSDAQSVQVSSAILGNKATTSVIGALATVPAQGSIPLSLDFPNSAGTSGQRVFLRLTGTYSGGSFSSSVRVLIP